MSHNKPNIIFLFSDQHRHDALGCAGNPAIQTPNLDRMADQGVRFTNTYCQSPICQPSRASIMTGMYSHQHGISRNTVKDFDPAWPTMMKQLKKKGYTTALVGKSHFYTPWRERPKDPSDQLAVDLREYAGFVRSFGFDYVLEEFDRGAAHVLPNLVTNYNLHLKEKGLLEPYRNQLKLVWRGSPSRWDGLTGVLPQEHDLTSFIADRSIDWLNSYDGKSPFFLMISFVAPHLPLIDDPVWADHYKNTRVPLGVLDPPDRANETWGTYIGNLQRNSNSHLLTEEYLLNSARHYYGMISLIDQRIDDIIKTVEEKGLGEDTWLIYSSDHGEMLGDHNLMGKQQFYKSAVRVPAIIRPPRGMEPKTVTGITESIDLTATITDIAGAEPIEDSSAKSLLPFLNGKGQAREVAFSAIEDAKNSDNYFIMAATDRYRLTMERSKALPCELFDLKEDPDETDNLINDPALKGVRDDLIKDYIEPHLAL